METQNNEKSYGDVAKLLNLSNSSFRSIFNSTATVENKQHKVNKTLK